MRREMETSVGLGWIDLERPKGTPCGLLAIGHGAGGGVRTVDIDAAATAALQQGFAVARITQPYRVAGRRAPAPAPKLDQAWAELVGTIRKERGLKNVRLINAGRSSGARVACRTAAAVNAWAVLALAFPEHPPGKPERSRLEEIDQVTVPTLVIQGARDPFGCPPEAPNRRVVILENDDHSLKRNPTAIAAAVTEFLQRL